jgi:hypothetical protein
MVMVGFMRTARGGRTAGVEFCWVAWLVALLSLLANGPRAAASNPQVFKLAETSVFSSGKDNFLRGQRAQSQDKPFAEVRQYPAFASQKPIYGSVRFAADHGQTNGGMLFYFAIDESKGTGKGYDRLYVDLNRDLDLRNDGPVSPQRNPPDEARVRYSDIKEQQVFNFVKINFDLGPAGTRAIEIMPRLVISVYQDKEYHDVSFVRTRLFAGEIKLGGDLYEALLGEDYLIRGRLDSPGTALILKPKAGGDPIFWWGGDRLMAVHKVHNQFYTFSTRPAGGELTVHPYDGDLGAFELGAGGRAIDKMSVSGSLEAREMAVPVGDAVAGRQPTAVRRCSLPVGDYRPNYLSLEYGRLGIALSFNYHGDGKPRDRGGRPAVYGLRVRKDQPCVFDFSNQPEVMFASPAREQRFKPGDTVEVKAVLIDPKLDFMIRRLDDTTRNAPGSGRGRLSLDPKVLITRADGQKVAEGVMPFG